MHSTFHSWKTDFKKQIFVVFVTPGHYACPRVFTVTNISYVTYFVMFRFFLLLQICIVCISESLNACKLLYDQTGVIYMKV